MDFEERTYEDEIETYVEFRPTLVMGLGGTGHEVLVRLKARFVETFGEDIFKVVKLLVFDTADESIPVPTDSGGQITLDRETELVNIGHVPVEGIIRNIDRHDTIKEWLPEKLPVRAITAGAKQIRPLGRLALFYHYNQDARVKDRLMSVIRSLANIKLKGAVGEGARVARTRGINVFIVSSLCGGTGSGVFLDIAYLVRTLIEQSGIPAEFCFTNGVLVLPEAFALVASDAIMANAYASLLELNYFTQEGGFNVRYPDNMMVSVHNRPFNICYLVDAVNEHGKVLTGLEELSPMIAESIFLQIGSQVGQAQKSVFDNVKSLDQQEADRTGELQPTAFSSLGTSSLVFPAGRIINTCAYRFGQQFIHDGLLKGITEGDPDQQAKQFVEKAQIIPKVLLTELARDDQGRPILIRLSASPLGKVPAGEIVRETERFLQMYEVRRLNGDYKRITDRNLERLRQSASKMLSEETIRLVDDPAYGPRYAAAFHDQLNQRLNALVGGFNRERQGLRMQIEKEKKSLTALRDSLNNAVGSFFLGRGGRVAKARDEYIEARQKEFGLEFEVHKRNLAIGLLSHLNTTLSELKKDVTTLIDKCSAIKSRFVREARELETEQGQMRFILSTDISDLRDITHYYDEYARPVPQELTRFLDKHGSLYDLGGQSEESIARTIFEFAKEPFLPINEERLERIVEKKRERMRPEQRLEDLREDSVPFWNYEAARMTGGGRLESIRVIGVEDKSNSICADLVRKGETLISTLDPHRITVLHSKHGLPIFALRQMDLYKIKYEDHITRRVSPLHLYSDLPWLEGEEVAYQWFALGQAFDFIEKTGVWYYCQPIDELEDKTRLAMGLEAALDAFTHNPRLVEDMARMIEMEINKIGNEQATRILQEYLDQPRSRDREVAKLEERLQKLARKFQRQMA